MNRSGLARLVASKTKLSRRQAESLVVAVCDSITKALEEDQKVIYSNFGSFYSLTYPSKTINHPKTGKKLIMLPTKVAKFMPADSFKRYVNDGIDPDPSDQNFSGTNIPINISSSTPKEEHRTENIAITEIDDEPENVKINVNESHTDSLKEAHDKDDIESYHQQKKTSDNPSNFFEEILKDGSHEFSTVDGAIRLHRGDKNQNDQKKNQIDIPDATEKSKERDNDSKSPLDLLREKLGLAKNTSLADENRGDKNSENISSHQDQATIGNESQSAPKISLASAGIFDKNPVKITSAPKPAEEQSSSYAEQKIENIKQEISEDNNSNENQPAVQAPEGGDKSKINTDINPDSLPRPYSDHASVFSGVEGSFNFDKARIEYKDLSKTIVPKELLGKIPENIARSYKAVVFEENDGIVSVAMVDPEDIETREMLKRILGEKIKISLATESDINSILNQYQGFETEVSSAIASAEAEDEEDEKEQKDNKKPQQADTVSDDAPAAKIVSSLLKRAIRDKASDIHIEPTEKEVEVRFRLDGVLRKKVSLPKEIQAAVVSRIKILSNLKIDEQRIPQDGRFNIRVDNRRVDFRVSSMPVAFGEKIVMRILDKDSGILTIEELGIGGSGLNTLVSNLDKSHGMILVTGPTGSGKSTTLYAMIQKVFNEGVNIITLEDPIEYQMKGINQSQVNSDIGYTFAAGLRSILRQDPDIIMLGEIRDKETAEMAVHAALTGHVVLSTLHTNDAAGAAPRMIDMGVEPFLLTSSINVVVGQRLVRTLCEECKEEIKIEGEELELIKKEIDHMPQAEKDSCQKRELKFFKGRGCKSCDNSGYKGRIGIYEVLAITPEMQQLILKRVSSAELNNLAISQGMVTMIQDGILKALDGITTMEEVWRATKN